MRYFRGKFAEAILSYKDYRSQKKLCVCQSTINETAYFKSLKVAF